jgi:serine/threonine protein kinase
MDRAGPEPGPALPITAPPGPLLVGQLLAQRYLVAAELGRGVGGVVYRALDQQANISVALKALHPQPASQEQTASRLYRELRFGRTLPHPHVCRIHDVLETEGRALLVMDLASGGTLRTTLARRQAGQPTEDETEGVLADARAVIAGLAAIHRADVVHRDLKPENILRMGDGRLVISDFGLAHVLESSTGSSVGLGTPGYLAPEILTGGRPDQASDVWSLGVVLHEILAGCRPAWVNGRLRARPGRRGRAEPARIALARVCEACLQTHRRARPATAGQVQALLETTLRGLQRRRGVARAVAALVVAAALPATALVASRPVEHLGEDWSRSRLLFQPPSQAGATCWQVVGPERRVVRLLKELTWPPQIVDVDIASGSLRSASVDPWAYASGCPVLSPDGRALLFVRDEGGRTRVMYSPRPDGRQAIPLVAGSSPTWLPGGRSFVFVTDRAAGQALAISDLEGHRQPLAASESTPGRIEDLAVDDRGERVAARVRRGSDSWFELHDLKSGRQVGGWPLPGTLHGRIDFDGERGAWRIPTRRGAESVLGELSPAGQLLPVGHIPGQSIEQATRVPGGLLLSSQEEGQGRTLLIRADGVRHIVSSTWVEYASASNAGAVVYATRVGGPGSDRHRLMYWRPGPPPRATLLAEVPGIGSPAISPDGRWTVYHRARERDFYLCDLEVADADRRCRPIHADPQLHTLPGYGPIGPDNDALPYFANVPTRDPGGANIRTKVLRVLFLQSRGVLEFGPLEATCGLVWTSERTFFVLRDSDPHWIELDLWSGRPTGHTWPRAAGGGVCFAIPPGQSSGHHIQRETHSDPRFVPLAGRR